MIQITLKGDVRSFESGITPAEIAQGIGAGLYKAACAARINGKVCDLRTPITADCELEILTFDDVDGKLGQPAGLRQQEQKLWDQPDMQWQPEQGCELFAPCLPAGEARGVEAGSVHCIAFRCRV